MKKLIIYILVILTGFVLAFFVFQKLHPRKTNTLIPQSPAKEQSTAPNNPVSSENTTTAPEESTPAQSAAPSVEVKPLDCDKGCEKYTTANDLEYCQEVCGLSATKANDSPNSATSGCSDKTALQKDYCLKDLAIAKNDFKLCAEIQNAPIKKTCQDRITQNLLEEKPAENMP